METIAGLKRGTEMAGANSAALAESQAACALVTSDWDSLLEAMNWAKEILHEIKKRLHDGKVVIATV